MSLWIRITQENLPSVLSQAEIDAYRRSPGDDGSDPVAGLLRQVAELVRGYVRANPDIVFDTRDPETIPPSLVNPALNLARFAVLNRIAAGNISEGRKKEYEAAIKLLESIKDRKFLPESHGDAENPKPDGIPAAASAVESKRRVTSRSLAGL